MEDQHTGESLACEEKERELKTQINELQQQISRVLQHRYANNPFYTHLFDYFVQCPLHFLLVNFLNVRGLYLKPHI
jgi:hypothetical protein